MSQHRKYYSEIPKIIIESDSLSSIAHSSAKRSKVLQPSIGSNVPFNNFVLATSNITEPHNETETDNLKTTRRERSKILTNIEKKQQAGLLMPSTSIISGSKKLNVSYAESKAFSDIKRSFLDDENEGLPEPLLFLKDTIKKETDPEDEYMTKTYFCTIKVDELIATVLTINTIFGGVIYHELKKIVEYGVLALDVTLYFVTINSALLSNLC
jgi:hypothetical protein